MKPLFKGRHFITLEEWTKPEIDTLLEVSKQMKHDFLNNVPTPYLTNQTAFLKFFEQSTNTTNSMEAELTHIGGHTTLLDHPLSTIANSLKLLSCAISTVNMISSMTGITAMTEACDFALSSTEPPTAMP